MDENIFFPEEGSSLDAATLTVATVGSYSSSLGTTLIFAGQSAATTKRYKRLSTYTPSAGARVLVAKLSGTYVILGAVTL